MEWDEKTDTVAPQEPSSASFSFINMIVKIWMRFVNISVRFGTWWLPILGIERN
ncbi:MAG: hypothetical protein FWG82_04130 [Oscillospiraceae bacterium]|nr:hypothetical protein [Oscillospiraceae bacterium]